MNIGTPRPGPTFGRRQVTLMITEACNLNCRYCYESHKTRRAMSTGMAVGILMQEFDQARVDGRTERLDIAFMGGEPFLNFPVIRDVSEWLWRKPPPLPFDLSVRCNGTVLDPETVRWLTDNRSRIDVGVSLDGPSMMNRLNRGDHAVDLRFFLDNWPTRRIKTVIFRDSVHLLASTVREMNREGIPFEAVLGEGFVWTPEAAGTLEHELMALIPDYVDRPDEARDCGLFSLRVADFFPRHKMTESTFCGRSNNVIAYDADGSPCICYLFSAPVVGYEKARWAWNHLRDVESVPFDPDCSDCPVHKNCLNCFGHNFHLGGRIDAPVTRTTICNAIKAKARACAALHLERMRGILERGGSLSQDDLGDAERSLKLLETLPAPG